MSDIIGTTATDTHYAAQVETINLNSFAVHSSAYVTVFNNICIKVVGRSGDTLDVPTQDALYLAFG